MKWMLIRQYVLASEKFERAITSKKKIFLGNKIGKYFLHFQPSGIFKPVSLMQPYKNTMQIGCLGNSLYKFGVLV